MKIKLNAKMPINTYLDGISKSYYSNSRRNQSILRNHAYDYYIYKNFNIVIFFFILIVLSGISYYGYYINYHNQTMMEIMLVFLGDTFIKLLLALPFILRIIKLKRDKEKINYGYKIMNNDDNIYLYIDDKILKIVVNNEDIIIRKWKSINWINVDDNNILFHCKNVSLSFFISNSHYKELEKVLKKINKFHKNKV